MHRLITNGLCLAPAAAVSIFSAVASAQTLEWTHELPGGTGRVLVDPQDNPVVLGTEGVLRDFPDWVVQKLQPDGAVLWTDIYDGGSETGGAESDAPRGLFVDDAGNVYATGAIGVDDGAFGSADAVTRKYAPDGSLLWTAIYDSTDPAIAFAVTTDADGNVYVTGGTDPATARSDVLTIKYDPNGVEQWARTFSAGPGDSIDFGRHIVVHGLDEIYVTGDANEATDQRDLLALRYDRDGDLLWSTVHDEPEADSEEPLQNADVTLSGDTYLASIFSYPGGGTPVGPYLTVKLDSSGALELVRREPATIPGTHVMAGVKADSAGNAVVVGTSLTPGYSGPVVRIIKYSPAGGVLWNKTYVDADRLNYARMLTVDAQDNIYVAGASLRSDLTEEDIFILKVDSNGVRRWLIHYDQPDTDMDEVVTSLTVDSLGNVYVTFDRPFSGGVMPRGFLLKFVAAPPFAPNPVALGDDVCSGGPNDGLPCSFNSDCPGGFCGMKNRYISVTPHNAGDQTVIQITALTLPPALAAFVGDVWYADAPAVVNENPGPGPTLNVASLGCDSGPGGFDGHLRDWGAEGLVNITGAIIVPGATYEVRQCTAVGGVCSDPLVIGTNKHGDVVAPLVNLQPNFQDISAMVAKFQASPGAISKGRAQMQPNVPNSASNINFLDISQVVGAFQGQLYGFPGDPCP